MRTATVIVLTILALVLFASASSAQTMNVYSVVDYHSSTNMVDAFAYTQPSYEAGVYYSVTTTALVRNDSYYTFGQGSKTKTDGSWADVGILVPGNGCQFYTIEAAHKDQEEYYVYYQDGYYQDGYYQDGWYDPYNFSYFGDNIPTDPYWQSMQFMGPGPVIVKQSQTQTYLGNTVDVSSGECNLAPEIQIIRNGQTIASNRTAPIIQNVIVGQKIELSTQTSGTASGRQWTLPANPARIGDFTNGCTLITDNGRTVCSNPSNGAVVALGATTNSTLSYYWIDGANGVAVQHSATVNNVSRLAVAKFNVKKPSIGSVSTAVGSIQVQNSSTYCSGSGPSLSFGNPPNTWGVTFTATNTAIPTGFSGEFTWEGIWSKNRSYKADLNGTLRTYASSATGIDTSFGAYASTGTVHRDAPLICLQPGWREATVSDSFDVYLMFQPTGGISIPLRKIQWNWSGTATSSNGTSWSLSTGGQGQVTSNQATLSFPEWTQNPYWVGYTLQP